MLVPDHWLPGRLGEASTSTACAGKNVGVRKKFTLTVVLLLHNFLNGDAVPAAL